jgi:pilus assembly protein CpaB
MTVLAVPAAKATQAGSLTLAVVANDVQAVLVSSAAGELRLVMPASDVSAPATGQVAAAAPSSVAAQGTGESR